MLLPGLIRRLVLAPLTVVINVVLVVLSPVLAVVAAVCGLAGRRRRPGFRGLRVLWFALVALTGETLTLCGLLGLWVWSGFGWRLRTAVSVRRHYALLGWFMGLMYWAGTSIFGVRVSVDGPGLTVREQADLIGHPVIVLSRHAGVGDSFLIVHYLLNVYRRQPRVVMTAGLQMDPVVDVAGHRVPNVFVSRGQYGEGVFAEQIGQLAGSMGPGDALVLFPEGGNWTLGRWRSAIARLVRQGRRDLAARAVEMPNVLAPRPGGVVAAITACPQADVVFVAHAGVDRLTNAGEVWRSLPLNRDLRVKWWRVPRAEVPREASREVQVQWLFDWWQRIDEWIAQNQPAEPLPLQADG
jgi:1-acyl-sn-glycerol-3-phosphate acyltransferase